ncbi:hypothetical protein [Pararhodonellum marinum]|uniref:hypothetical protein n=1 Tax=Pararhodonellum marinum TaxID=2755358 RepID=UPI00188DED13|nr:hypothetical protein [Pararhodonellum marinum]
MKETEESVLLRRAFLIGVVSILLCIIPLIDQNFPFLSDTLKPSYLGGLGIAGQLLALSMAILVLRRRKIPEPIKDKAKRMIIVLAVALIYFFMVI